MSHADSGVFHALPKAVRSAFLPQLLMQEAVSALPPISKLKTKINAKAASRIAPSAKIQAPVTHASRVTCLAKKDASNVNQTNFSMAKSAKLVVSDACSVPMLQAVIYVRQECPFLFGVVSARQRRISIQIHARPAMQPVRVATQPLRTA